LGRFSGLFQTAWSGAKSVNMMRFFLKLKGKMPEIKLPRSILKTFRNPRNLVIVLLSLLALIVCVRYCVSFFHRSQSSPLTQMMFQRNSLFSGGSLDTNGKTLKSIHCQQEGSGMPSCTLLPFRSEQSLQESGPASKKGPVSNGRKTRFKKWK
jgi:hypothetical protein